MNKLINLIYLWIAFYFILPNIKNCGPNGCYDPFILLGVSFVVQSIYHIFLDFMNKKKIKPSVVIRETIIKSLLIVLGSLIYGDLLSDESSFLKNIKEATVILNSQTIETTLMTLPILITT